MPSDTVEGAVLDLQKESPLWLKDMAKLPFG